MAENVVLKQRIARLTPVSDAPNADVERAMGQGTLAVGMTLDQCNKLIGSPGRVAGADVSGRMVYVWGKSDDGRAARIFIGTILGGKLVTFYTSRFVAGKKVPDVNPP